jgi:coenzyme F420-0:L-glutamate ligase/coenzyme F420-1:gamma-L-glutamate ligase
MSSTAAAKAANKNRAPTAALKRCATQTRSHAQHGVGEAACSVENGVRGEVRILPIAFKEEIRPGDSLSKTLLEAMGEFGLRLENGDILVVKHKIVSKSEGAMVSLDSIRPSAASRAWARRHGLDARVCELAKREGRRVVRQKHGVLITETRHGFVCANSGVDVSNVDGGQHAVLLPEDPDWSAAKLRRELKKQFGLDIGVIVSDSFGRAWREGLTDVAIGVAGLRPLVDYRGRRDPHGYRLHGTVHALADELACAAGLVSGKLARTPACIIRGVAWQRGKGSARELIRPAKRDLFR